MGIYWKISYFLRDKYLDIKYNHREPGFYYDSVIHEYVHPSLLRETSINIEYIAEELTRCGLYYPFKIGENDCHQHEFSTVLRDAYAAAGLFSVPEEYEQYYSEQELKMVRALAKRGIDDGCRLEE